jgi:kynurenine formamidase
MKRGDEVITRKILEKTFRDDFIDAVVVRSLPNSDEKLRKNYSNTNPAYFEPEALSFLREKGVKHLLTDLPSVDREEDGGKLVAHHAFWKGGRPSDNDCTITEFIYVPDEIEDGLYLLNLQIASFENDAAPSKPVLYKLHES